jgi:hypothetical protein
MMYARSSSGDPLEGGGRGPSSLGNDVAGLALLGGVQMNTTEAELHAFLPLFCQLPLYFKEGVGELGLLEVVEVPRARAAGLGLTRARMVIRGLAAQAMAWQNRRTRTGARGTARASARARAGGRTEF